MFHCFLTDLKLTIYLFMYRKTPRQKRLSNLSTLVHSRNRVKSNNVTQNLSNVTLILNVNALEETNGIEANKFQVCLIFTQRLVFNPNYPKTVSLLCQGVNSVLYDKDLHTHCSQLSSGIIIAQIVLSDDLSDSNDGLLRIQQRQTILCRDSTHTYQQVHVWEMVLDTFKFIKF